MFSGYEFTPLENVFFFVNIALESLKMETSVSTFGLGEYGY